MLEYVCYVYLFCNNFFVFKGGKMRKILPAIIATMMLAGCAALESPNESISPPQQFIESSVSNESNEKEKALSSTNFEAGSQQESDLQSNQQSSQEASLKDGGAVKPKLKLDSDFASVEYFLPFGKGKETLGKQGRAKFKKIAAEAKNADKVTLHGRAAKQEMDSSQRSIKLALGRGLAVREALIREGVAPKKIRTYYKTFNEPNKQKQKKLQKVIVRVFNEKDQNQKTSELP
jgi:outer membrane protein OmpA-like peptidoglycan-associated protein